MRTSFRTMRGRRTAFVACGLSTLAVTTLARAQHDEQPVRIAYTAPADCPAENVFFAQVRARAFRVRRATDDEAARAVTIAIATSDGKRMGKVVIEAPDATRAEREVVGENCDQVVAALALITALALDPNALTEPAAPMAETPSADASAPPPSIPASLRPSPSPVEASHSWHLALAADVAAVVGVSPRVIVGVPLVVEASAGSSGWFSPTLRVGFERASSGAIGTQGTPGSSFLTGPAEVTFTWTVGFLEACPVGWTVGDVRIEPCARLEAGTLEGASYQVTPSHDVSSAWLDVGAVGRAEWQVFRPLFLELQAGLRVPVIQGRFIFEPDSTIYEPAVLGSVVSGGLGARIW
jgi:hypothetical protein